MTVYEMIQELAKYPADVEVKAHLKAKFDTDVDAEFNREDKDDTQNITVDVSFDDDVDIEDIDDRRKFWNDAIVINLSY